MAVMDRTERVNIIRRYASELKFPQLFVILLILFVVDLFFPDPILFVDEAILGILTLLLGMWKDRKKAVEEPPMKDVTPRD
jgi:hypothetical protein